MSVSSTCSVDRTRVIGQNTPTSCLTSKGLNVNQDDVLGFIFNFYFNLV